MSGGATEHPIPNQPVYIVWNGDGSYTPRCDLCTYIGKAKPRRSEATAAIRHHVTAREHRMLMRRKED